MTVILIHVNIKGRNFLVEFGKKGEELPEYDGSSIHTSSKLLLSTSYVLVLGTQQRQIGPSALAVFIVIPLSLGDLVISLPLSGL